MRELLKAASISAIIVKWTCTGWIPSYYMV